MPDGISRVAGLGGVVELGGRQFLIKGRTVEFYALLEAEVLRLRGDPFPMVVQAAVEHKHDPMVVDLVAATVAERFRNWRMATYYDYAQFFRTPYGNAFQIWAAIKHNDPTLTVSQVQFWLMEMFAKEGEKAFDKRDEIIASIDQATSADSLGNSLGPQPTIPMTAGA